MPKRSAEVSPSEAVTPPVTKERVSKAAKPSVAEFVALDAETVDALSKETLVLQFLQFQAGYIQRQSAAAKNPLSTSSGNAVAAAEDPAKIREKAVKLATMASSGIEKQMKWQ